MKTLEVFVDIVPLPLSAAGMNTLRRADRYDRIVFTSKHAEQIFITTLRKHGVPIPKKKIVRVGPRNDLLKLDLAHKRILFPRSALAPHDIVRKLRTKGAVVTPLKLYTAHGRTLSPRDKLTLISGGFKRLYFKSPSGIDGLLRQLPRKSHPTIKKIPALCIGETTATAARAIGFERVSAKKV